MPHGAGAGELAEPTGPVILEISGAISNTNGTGVETRRWWGDGCHAQRAFTDCPRADLAITNDLARRSLGLPFHLGIGPREINAVVSALADALVLPTPALRHGAVG